MANLPVLGVPRREERHDLFAVSLRPDVLSVLGHITDEEVGMVEHHKILFGAALLTGHQLSARDVQQFDGHPPGIANAVKLRVGVAVGQAHHGVPGLARFGEDTLTQGRIQVAQHLNLGVDATMCLGVSIAQVAGVFPVLIDNFEGGLNRIPGHRGFAGRDFLLRGHRPAVLPGIPAAGQCPADQPQRYQCQQQLAQP